MFPAQYLFADTGRSVHKNEKIVWKHSNFYSMNNYEQNIYSRIMYTIVKRILLYFITENHQNMSKFILLRKYFYRILIPILLPRSVPISII